MSGKNNNNCKSKGGYKPTAKVYCNICDERVGKM